MDYRFTTFSAQQSPHNMTCVEPTPYGIDPTHVSPVNYVLPKVRYERQPPADNGTATTSSLFPLLETSTTMI
ncbi:hypothetical protein [Trueperella sp. LYQ143]|uniref:hypothetical protein n=1 Tax=Trueperella sp. LYQ143 TaxID=3391059 RepID=UPI0039835C08